jgi:metal-sulfur cluster biosynthetic enzyme
MTAAARLRKQTWQALETVLDPELDQPITDLGFVRSVTIDGDCVEIHLRLPTAFCSPNFAYLMTSDAYDAVGSIAGARSVRIQLDDHHDSDRINAGVAAHAGFVGTYGAEAAGELDALRVVFRRKAHLACLDRACRDLISRGWEVEDLHRATVGDLGTAESARLCRRRTELGLSTRPDALVLLDDAGSPIRPEDVSKTLRFARTARVSIDGNAHFCRDLLRTRYPGAEPAERSCEAALEAAR